MALEDTNLVTLFLDYNVSDYLSPTSAIPVEKLQAIQTTLQNVDTSNFDTEETFFYNLALAHTDLLLREPKEVVQLLNDISEIDAIPSFRYHYTDIGLVRRAAILGTAFEVLGEIDQAISVYASTSHLINDSIGNSLRRWCGLSGFTTETRSCARPSCPPTRTGPWTRSDRTAESQICCPRANFRPSCQPAICTSDS